MTFGEFLSNRLGRVFIQLIFAAVAAFFLVATGTQAGIILLLFLVFLLVFAATQLFDFFRQKSRLHELEAIMEGLDQKYLFTECVPMPKELYEKKIFDLVRRAGRSMIGTVSDAQIAQREYREYVEGWVHEIKTPITAAGLICRNAEDDIRRKLTRELGQIEAYVERTLFYARAESPEKDFIIRQTVLSELVAQAIDHHRVLLMQSGIRMEMEELEQEVFTDSKWVIFILGQLLQNAIRYRGENPVVSFSAKKFGKQIHLTVSDNGIGIPEYELPRVFDRGFTGSNGRSRGGSTGMGLYLCKKLADCLEIDIRITAKEGRGTAVTLSFYHA